MDYFSENVDQIEHSKTVLKFQCTSIAFACAYWRKILNSWSKWETFLAIHLWGTNRIMGWNTPRFAISMAPVADVYAVAVVPLHGIRQRGSVYKRLRGVWYPLSERIVKIIIPEFAKNNNFPLEILWQNIVDLTGRKFIEKLLPVHPMGVKHNRFLASIGCMISSRDVRHERARVYPPPAP